MKLDSTPDSTTNLYSITHTILIHLLPTNFGIYSLQQNEKSFHEFLPFLFKPSLLSREGLFCCGSSFCSALRQRFVMPRGWHQTPSGWWQRSIRCPRPKSEKWPRAGTQQPSQPGRSRGRTSQDSSSPVPHRCNNPAARQSQFDAIANVSRLESAIAVLGEDNPHARPLLDALRVAKTQATVLPTQDRIKACKAFLDRAKKRVSRAEAVIARAVEQKTIFDGRLRTAPGIVGGGSESSRAITKSGGASATDRRSGAGARVVESFSDSQPKGAARRVVRGGTTMRQEGPTSPPGPRGTGRVDRDLRNALEFGDAAPINQIGNLLSQGITQFARSPKDVVMGQSRPSMMESMIEESDAKRRLVQVGSVPSALPSMLGNQM